MQVDPWLSVNVTHNIGDVVHQKVHKQHSNVIESFIHIGSYSTLCFINSLSFLLWIQVEYFCWNKGMCQCTTQGYFHPLGLIPKKFPNHRVLVNPNNLLNICDLTNYITSFKFNYFKMLPNILCIHICSCIVLWLVNGWNIPIVESDMRLLVWLYTPRRVFLMINCVLSLVQNNCKIYSCMCLVELKL